MPKKKSVAKGKEKRKANSTEKKVWVEKKYSVMAKGETISTKIVCRPSKGSLLVKEMDDEEEAEKN